eukprot:3810059-Rhodomonas_salina.1
MRGKAVPACAPALLHPVRIRAMPMRHCPGPKSAWHVAGAQEAPHVLLSYVHGPFSPRIERVLVPCNSTERGLD